jgi:D-aminopeptidase
MRAVVEGTEEAVLNALFRATTTRGRLGRVVEALPVAHVIDMLKGSVEYYKN